MALSANQQTELLNTLKARFEHHMNRHADIAWEAVQAKLEASPKALLSLYKMEHTGGEPDVVGIDAQTGEYLFYDCSPESPDGRRNTCYDRAAQVARKKAAPANNAVEMATQMGITLLNEAEYRTLQKLGTFDAKTSSWIDTPADIRERGGALFADYRYGHIFIYHNGVQSYYTARGFRGVLRV